MNRRHFFGTLAGAAAALAVGPEVLEAFERLTHRRRVWTGADFGTGRDTSVTLAFNYSAQVTVEYWRAVARNAGAAVPDRVYVVPVVAGDSFAYTWRPGERVAVRVEPTAPLLTGRLFQAFTRGGGGGGGRA